MTKEQEALMTKEDRTTIWALDIIAGIVYQTAINIQSIQLAYRKIPQCPLKDMALLFEENQKNWLNKVMKAAKNFGQIKGINFAETLQEDISGDGLIALFSCVSKLRMFSDLETMEDILDVLVKENDLQIALNKLKQ